MALKGDRYLAITEVSFFMNNEAERGGVAVLKTDGSGAFLDQQAAEVEYATLPSGKLPVGLLLNEMVNKDLTRTHLNFHKDEMQKGSKVSLMRQGWVVTNMFFSATGVLHKPAAGQPAYLGASGLITAYTGANLENPCIGVFEGALDETNFARVQIQLPGPSKLTSATAV